MTSPRRWFGLVLALAVVALAATLPCSRADARSRGKDRGTIIEYTPSTFTEAEFRNLLFDPDRRTLSQKTTIVFGKGTYDFTSEILVLRRQNLTICGATGRPGDVTIRVSDDDDDSRLTGFRLIQTENITFRDLTIEAEGDGVFLNTFVTSVTEGFVNRTRLESCVVEAIQPINAQARVSDLTVHRCRLNSLGDSCLVWGDGDLLQVSRTRFATVGSVIAFAAIFVQGASAANSNGRQPQEMILFRNTVRGDFLRGFDLVDIANARIRRNKIIFANRNFIDVDPSELVSNAGREGIVVRRRDASGLPSDFEITRNRVRRAHVGLFLAATRAGFVAKNDLKGCGSAAPDDTFGDEGGAMRLVLQTFASCGVEITKNDFRNLTSPSNRAAVLVSNAPGSVAMQVCFGEGDRENRITGSRPLIEGDDS